MFELFESPSSTTQKQVFSDPAPCWQDNIINVCFSKQLHITAAKIKAFFLT